MHLFAKIRLANTFVFGGGVGGWGAVPFMLDTVDTKETFRQCAGQVNYPAHMHVWQGSAIGPCLCVMCVNKIT